MRRSSLARLEEAVSGPSPCRADGALMPIKLPPRRGSADEAACITYDEQCQMPFGLKFAAVTHSGPKSPIADQIRLMFSPVPLISYLIHLSH